MPVVAWGPMFTDRHVQWGLISRVLHWGTAAVLLVEIPLGLWLEDAGPSYGLGRDVATGPFVGSAAHHTLGFAVLLLVLIRVNWRLQVPRPAASSHHSRGRRWAARANQWLMVALLFLVALSGWAALSSSPDDLPIYVFGWEMPRMYETLHGTTFTHDVFAVVHGYSWIVLLLLVLGHMVAAGWTQWGEGDPVITRMWNGSARPPEP